MDRVGYDVIHFPHHFSSKSTWVPKYLPMIASLRFEPQPS